MWLTDSATCAFMLCDPIEVAAAPFHSICRQRSMSDVPSFVPDIARSLLSAPLRVAALGGVLLALGGCDAVQESFGLDRGTASEVVSTSTLPVFDPANPVSAFPANTLDPSGDVARYSLGLSLIHI